MNERSGLLSNFRGRLNPRATSTSIAAAICLWSVSAQAQDPPPPPPEGAAPVVAPLVISSPEPGAKVESKGDDALDPKYKTLNLGVWLHLGGVFQNPTDSKKMDDVSANAEVNVVMSGNVHKNIGYQANFVATYGAGAETGSANILDLIAKLEFDERVQLWFGRMLVASDRSNFSGPWFMAPWNYPGFGSPGRGLSRTGASGRGDGATVWGQIEGGVFKYYAGVYNLHDATQSPLFSGRVSLSLFDPEPGYYSSSTYYGEKDVLTLGLGAQSQKNGSVAGALVDDYSEVNADVLFEKNLAGIGVVDLEGAFYKFGGDYKEISHSFFLLGSLLFPQTVGIGRLQPLLRFQQAKPRLSDDSVSLIDAQVGYVIDKYAARMALGYQRGDFGDLTSNAIFFGIQLQR